MSLYHAAGDVPDAATGRFVPHPGAHAGQSLPPLRRINRRTFEYAGACPFCGGGNDRFRVWKEPGNERYWCRRCQAKGRLSTLDPSLAPPASNERTERSQTRDDAPVPSPEHVPFYRQLYAAVAEWAQEQLWLDYAPDALQYLHRRGLHDTMIRHAQLGTCPRDGTLLLRHLEAQHPDLLPYAEEAGVLWRDARTHTLQTHPNLCGCLVFPYHADGAVVDLRTRTIGGKGYRSLAGGYADRGALFPYGWDELDGADTVLVTEGEFKALLHNQAYRAGALPYPAIAHPGLSYVHSSWPEQLRARSVTTVVLGYDSQPRPLKDEQVVLAPEEYWTLRHGQTLASAEMQVRVLRLPLPHGSDKADLDAFLVAHGAAALRARLHAAPLLADYHASIPRSLLAAAQLPVRLSVYPAQRPRPQRVAEASLVPEQENEHSRHEEMLSLEAAREQIPALVAEHAASGEGFLVLTHPPGVGKGYGATQGLLQYQQENADAGRIVWTALRKEQLYDQQGLELLPLNGRNGANCGKLPEAQTLAAKGYGVRAALCERRCPFVNNCAYLRQFHQEGDVFAPLPLLQATGWWVNAGVVVLDEFDPARLLHIVTLRPSDLAAMTRASDDGNAHTVLRWLGSVVGATLDHALTSVTLLAALDTAAAHDGQCFRATLEAALDTLPPAEEQAYLRDLPLGATLADYQQLPPGYLPVLLHQLAHEEKRRQAGQPFTSRLEARDGVLQLLLRHEHVIAQLARAEQPKVLLDATANTALLRALFPTAPLHLVQPALRFPNRVVQVVRSDWAKSTLGGERRAAWYDAVSRHIRPDRPTLVVCTLDCEAGLREALSERGHRDVVVEHYGGLRGSNAYQGYDVVLAQVYHPSLDALVREGRALFADDPTPLDERVTTEERQLRATNGEMWTVSVPTFVDARLAALLEARREAELLQAALRGRPFDHPEAQITLLFSLPLARLPPTEILEDAPEGGNASRAAVVVAQLIAAGRALLEAGRGLLNVYDLAKAARVSVTTVRNHWRAIASALRLRPFVERRTRPMPRGGFRLYMRAVLLPRGRRVPPPEPPPTPESASPPTGAPPGDATEPEKQDEPKGASADILAPTMIDHPPDLTLHSGLIHHQSPAGAAHPPRTGSGDASRAQAPPNGTEDG